MRSLGVDLASGTAGTAICVLEWRAAEAQVVSLESDVDDERILLEQSRADVTGIDCPFGWPVAFRQMLLEATKRPWSPTLRLRWRFRFTDRAVHKHLNLWPLSVSSERIAVPAMRCQTLLQRMGVTDRSGDGRVFEVYPAASLKAWEFRHRRYKGPENVDTLQGLVAELASSAGWLRWTPGHVALLSTCDHAFDALIASLTAHAAACGLTSRPRSIVKDFAKMEGWIALPQKGSLNQIVNEPSAARETLATIRA